MIIDKRHGECDETREQILLFCVFLFYFIISLKYYDDTNDVRKETLSVMRREKRKKFF